MVAEKILESNGWNTQPGILAAMQSYADFFYWLGKEGWVVTGDKFYNNKIHRIKTESELYEKYLTIKKW